MRGDELARLCRARLPALPIILATGYDEGRYASSVAADPLLAVLQKPFDTPRLLIRLESFGVYAPAGNDCMGRERRADALQCTARS